MALALTAAGFAALILLSGASMAGPGRWVGVTLFVALPLLGLRLAAGPGVWRRLLPHPTARDLGIGLAFAPVSLLVSSAVGYVVMQTGLTAANPAIALMERLKGWDLALFALSTLPQLLGEELIAVVSFLALLVLARGLLRLRRASAVLMAWISASLIFGALHLPTYQWHVVQALVVIGSARMVLLAPYLITRNLWSSTLAHIANDWAAFGLFLAVAAQRSA